MNAKFEVHNTFTLESQRLFVVVGEILEGTIKQGMLTEVGKQSELLVRTMRIESFQLIQRTGRRLVLGLCFRYSSREEARTRETDIVPGIVLEFHE